MPIFIWRLAFKLEFYNAEKSSPTFFENEKKALKSLKLGWRIKFPMDVDWKLKQPLKCLL